MDVVRVSDSNLNVYMNLCQSYEGEFSSITNKKPDKNGLFELDTRIEGNVVGYLLYDGEVPLGFAAVNVAAEGNAYEICEFYIVPVCRKQGMGREFVSRLFRMYRGRWEVKQISGAEHATAFWRKAIGGFTKGKFQEDFYNDAYWGRVIRQRFDSANLM
ncbi:GNAT family N-acetyltransferase [Desulfobotulus mexicanus]|uniref:GNAT family N-acetyltransferase n=2 Tax=Desulfobotulus mexicanus TaxID=2586642 RepID=A0A5S5MEZ4_9BACT|nr:GNAT family N-acetyltransferase [Desulfobotulus mexicanus]